MPKVSDLNLFKFMFTLSDVTRDYTIVKHLNEFIFNLQIVGAYSGMWWNCVEIDMGRGGNDELHAWIKCANVISEGIWASTFGFGMF